MISAVDVFNGLRELAEIAECEEVRLRFDSGFDMLILHFVWGDGLNRNFAIPETILQGAPFDFFTRYAERAGAEARLQREQARKKANAKVDSGP